MKSFWFTEYIYEVLWLSFCFEMLFFSWISALNIVIYTLNNNQL